MSFGKFSKNDYERVAKRMHENNLTDPVPSKRTLSGDINKVMNLRPLQKDKHLHADSFRIRGTV